MSEIRIEGLSEPIHLCKPFTELHGFNPRWWHGYADVANSRECYEWVVLIVDNAELGRAEVMGERLDTVFTGLSSPVEVKEIQFFEIREGHRGERLGTKFIALLEARYPGETLIVFSEDADDFWERIGWMHQPRAFGDTTGMRKMFTSKPLR